MLIARGSPTLDVYSTYLRATYGLVAPLEAALQGLPAELSDELELGRRRKADLLVGDLAELSQLLGEEPRRVPWCSELPARGSVPEALGALYVVEGSTLGSRWLLRHLAPLCVERCCSYLLSYGEELKPMWQKLRASLTRYAQAHPEAEPRMIAAALDTFQRWDAWFVRCGAAEASQPA